MPVLRAGQDNLAKEHAVRAEDRHPATQEKARWFDFDHLPSDQRQVSVEFARMAQTLIARLLDGPQLTIALQKLLDSKDAAVRQAIVDAETRRDNVLP
jgi:hypothetical protein